MRRSTAPIASSASVAAFPSRSRWARTLFCRWLLLTDRGRYEVCLILDDDPHVLKLAYDVVNVLLQDQKTSCGQEETMRHIRRNPLLLNGAGAPRGLLHRGDDVNVDHPDEHRDLGARDHEVEEVGRLERRQSGLRHLNDRLQLITCHFGG